MMMSQRNSPDARLPNAFRRFVPLLVGSALLFMAAPTSAQLPALPAAQVDAGLDLPVQPIVQTAAGLDPTGTAGTVTSLLPAGDLSIDASAGTQGVHACADALAADLCADAEVPDTSFLGGIQDHAMQAVDTVQDVAMSFVDAIQDLASEIAGLFSF